MVSAWRTLSPSSCSTRAPPSPGMLSPASLLNQAVREAHPEVVLAVLGRGVDQPSARATADPCLDPHYHSRGAESGNLLKHQCTLHTCKHQIKIHF